MTPTPTHASPAIEAASRRARLFGVLPRTFARLVTGVAAERDEYWRALHKIERRAIVSRLALAYRSSARDVDAPTPEPRDPWSVDPARIETESRRVIICAACTGTREVVCTDCSGTTRVRCRGCFGSGRVLGKKKMKNCPTCRGKGDVRCGECRGGRVECRACGAMGRVEHWYVVERETRFAVVTSAKGLAVRAHPNVREPTDFDASAKWRNTLAADDAVEPASVHEALLPPVDARTERILESRVQRFVGDVSHITCETGLGRARFSTAGSPPMVVDAQTAPLLLRLAIIVCTLLGSAAFVALLDAAYTSRHAWFSTPAGNSGTLCVLGLVCAVALAAWTGHVCLGRRAWRPLAFMAPLVVAGLAAIGGLGIALRTRPSLASAESFFRRGDLQSAELEADAARTTLRNARAAEALLDRIHLARIDEATTATARDSLERRRWFSDEARAQGMARECSAAAAEVAGAARNDDVAQLERLLAFRAPCPRETARLPAALAWARLHGCMQARDWECAEGRYAELAAAGVGDEEVESARQVLLAAVDSECVQALSAAGEARALRDRQAALRSAFGLAMRFDRLSRTSRSTRTVAIESRLARVDRDVAREDERAARALARQVAAEQRARQLTARAEAREQARRQRALRTPERRTCAVQCCDGTCSPTCQYVHRGCCSHHGGVCGG